MSESVLFLSYFSSSGLRTIEPEGELNEKKLVEEERAVECCILFR
jgi:hypothetical protein